MYGEGDIMANVQGKKGNSATWIMLSMVLGVVAGALGGEAMGQIQFIGDIFFRLIQMGIVPFVMLTIAEAVGGLTARDLSGIGVKGIAWFASSSILAALFGMFMAVVFQPGAGLATTELVQNATTTVEATGTTWQETIVGFFGSNIVASMSAGSMVQCIVFAIALGLIISFWRTSHGGESVVYDFISELGKLLLNVIRGVMKIAPIGIFCYVSSMVGKMGLEVLLPLVKYLLVLGGAVFLFLVAWTALVCVRCKLNPIVLVRKMWPMSALALGTISSAVTLPVEMDDAKHRIGIRSDIADLLLPLGMPLNSNGAAIHLAVTALTIAQIYGVTFQGADFVYLAIMFTLLSLANAVAPGADIVSLTMIVPQLGLPLASIGIFAGLTYPVGAIRTILNVDSDVYCALMVAASEKNGIDRKVFDS